MRFHPGRNTGLPMKVPKRLYMGLTSARDWYVFQIELGERVVEAIRAENPYGWTYR